MTQSSAISFDGWTFHRESGELEKEGVRVRLQDLPLQLLNELLVRPGEMVTREDLIAKLWPTGVIDFDTSLNSAVRKLHAALDDDADSPRYVETVPRRGYRFIGKIAEAGPIAAHQDGSHHKGPWLAVAFGAVVLFAVAVAIGVRFFGIGGSGSGRVASEPAASHVVAPPAPAVAPPAFNPPEHSIAVLPFVNMSGDPQQEYFSDGLAEELLNSLVRISELKVAARTSAFAFKGKDLEVGEIARRLNVGSILEGSVRKVGEKVRITVQLVDATNGYQLWSRTYDRRLDNIFEVQADIATNVVRQLQATLLGSALPQHMPSPEAYAAYLQGNHLFDRFQNDRAIFYYEQALQLDDHYAAAMVGLAQARFGYGFGVRADTDVAQARQLIERAIALEPALAEAYVVRARIARIYDFDWTAAEASMTRARELEPGRVTVLLGLGILAATLGRLDESVASLRQALERDPLNPAIHIELGQALLSTGKPAAAEASFRTYLELSPVGSRGHYLIARALFFRGEPEKALAEANLELHDLPRVQALALVYYALHRQTEADAALRELTEKYAREAAFRIAEVHAYRREADQAMRWLEQAHRNREGEVSRLLQNPLLRALAHDPRYQAFLRKMNLPTDARL
jgi:TolB-like protein/DNA-binding winged helix-turn-helix (wHTH) protein/Flp pilus assembly protein TadD